jgi:hypothetical protein
MGALIAHDPPPPAPAVIADVPKEVTPYVPDWAIGWSYGVDSIHISGRDGAATMTLGLAVSRRLGRAQVRAEGATLVDIAGPPATSPGYGDRLGAAVRYAPLAAQIGYDRRASVALAVDAGAGAAWWFDRAGSATGPYAMLGTVGSITIGGFEPQSPSKVLITAFGVHAYAFGSGWSVLASMELDWGR